MNLKIEIESLESISKAVEKFIPHFSNHSIFAFYGEMGVGKTTFIKELCTQLGVEEAISSPTFSIVNEYYANIIKRTIYHFDFYRIKNVEEVYDLGYEEYIYSDAICLMEWPEKIEALLPEECVKVFFTLNPDNSRTLSF